MTAGNRYNYTTFIDNDLTYSEWGDAKYFLFQWGLDKKQLGCNASTEERNEDPIPSDKANATQGGIFTKTT